MPVQIEWEKTEPTTLHYRFQDPWNWDDFYTTLTAVMDSDELQQPQGVTVVVDLSATAVAAEGIMMRFDALPRSTHPAGQQLRSIHYACQTTQPQ